jgi:hypothetical protein
VPERVFDDDRYIHVRVRTRLTSSVRSEQPHFDQAVSKVVIHASDELRQGLSKRRDDLERHPIDDNAYLPVEQ